MSYQEITLEFAGNRYSLRPEFRIITQCESALGMSSRSIGRRLSLGDMPLGDTAALLEIVLKDKTPKLTQDQIRITLMEEGMSDLVEPLGTFFLDAIRGTKWHEKEAKRAAAGGNPPGATDG